jgi:ABC-type transport system involved in multi-copper enzyme maturation permease subunit
MGRMRGLVWAAFAYALLLEAMLAAAVLFWPEFAENLTAFRGMTQAIPIAREMLGEIEDKGFLAYVIAQHFFKGANALGVAAAALFAAPMIAGEAHRGTLELLLARPFSRRRILLERWLAGALATTLPVFLTTLTLPWLAARVDEELVLAPYLACAAHQALFLLALYSVTFLLSSGGSNPTRIALVALFVAVSQFALYMVKTVTHWSLFRLSDMQVLIELADQGTWNGSILATLGVTVLASLAGALAVFERRTP